MKRLFIIIAVIFLTALSVTEVKAERFNESVPTDELLSSIPENARDALKSFGIDEPDADKISSMSFESFAEYIVNNIFSEAKGPMSVLGLIIAVMLIYSLVYSIRISLANNTASQALGVCSTLAIGCLVVAPISSVITCGCELVMTSANVMLAFLPVMAGVLIGSGKAASSASFNGIMLLCCEGVSQIIGKLAAPFLRIFFALGISSAISPETNLSGIMRHVSGFIKWLLGISMTVFTMFLSFKQIIASGVDSASGRAVRLGLSGMVPIVGSALSEAYQTVTGSVGLMKNGLGVFVIIALAVMYIPTLIKCVLWIVTLNIGKAAGEVLNLREPVLLIESARCVTSTLVSVMLCVVSVFIISTGIILVSGGA